MNELFTKNSMKANLGNSYPALVALLLSVFLVTPAHADKKDYEQEITIKSQRQSADLKNKIASYLDSVSIRQGSISITADIVKVFSETDKDNGIKTDTYLANGKPAIFKQKLEDGTYISLQADEITFHPMSNVITVSGNAVVKQAGSEVSGSEITYNTLSEKLEAKSLDNQSVTTILQPTVIKKNTKKTDKKMTTDKTVMATEEGENSGN